MQIGQNKPNPRGPLIAVIKIQLDENNHDRIFLHQRDSDYQQAILFVQKHNINPALAQHIHERIKFSRASVQNSHQEATPRANKKERPMINYSNSNYKLQTPVNHNDPTRKLFQEEQSFGNPGSQSQRYQYLRKVYEQPDNFIQPEVEDNYRESLRYCEDRVVPMTKKEVIRDNQFLLYDYGEQKQEEQNLEFDLFDSKKITAYQPNQMSLKKFNKDDSRQMINQDWDKKKMKDVLSIIKQQESQQRILRESKSMIKLGRQQPLRGQPIMSTPIGLNTSSKSSAYDKPSHVKIIRKQEMSSLNHSLKRSKSKQQISRINKDVTNRLYNETTIKQNYLKIIKEKARKDKHNEVDPQLTLKPQINKVSKVIAQGRKRSDLPIEDYLMEEGKRIDNKRSQDHHKKIIEQIEKCSFKPTLNLISQKLSQDRNKNELRTTRRSRYQDQNKFHPNLNKISNELMRDKGTFIERQKQYLEIKHEKLMNLVQQRILKEKIDLNTGQQLFKPVINDLGVRESQGDNIGNYLHQLGKEGPQSFERQQVKPKISESSQMLVQQMYMKRVTWLFSQLDSDQDGLISAHKICIESISPEVLSVIKPILFQLQQINEELTLLQFKNAIEILHKKLNLNEKSVLYNYQHKNK